MYVIYVRTYVCTYVCVCVCVCVCMYVCLNIYIYTHTHTHTHAATLHANTYIGQQLTPIDINYIIYGDSFNVSTSARAQTYSLTAKTKV